MRRLVPLLAALAACSRPGTTTTVDFQRPIPPGVTGGTWVARFGGETVTDAELARRFAEMNPYARARFQTVEQRREYVDSLVRYELLAREAVRQGLASDPEVRETTRRLMVQLLLKKELEQAGEAPAADVEQYYRAHTSDYVKPAMTRLMHIFFTRDHRDQAQATLDEVLKLSPMDYAAFQALARSRDEDEHTRALDGDMRFLTDDELTTRHGPAVAAAAAALKQVGEVAPALVETEAGFHVLKLQGRQAALNLSLEQARPSIVQVVQNERRQQRFRALLERLKAASGLEVNDAAVAGIAVDPRAPAVEAKGPPAGTLADPGGQTR